MRIALVGGGIGGLALALGLHQRGVRCAVYEQAHEVRVLGVGITLLPHAMKELAALGAQDADQVALAFGGHRPFPGTIDDLISQEELRRISQDYQNVAGFSLRAVR